jgi:hypothetical protein
MDELWNKLLKPDIVDLVNADEMLAEFVESIAHAMQALQREDNVQNIKREMIQRRFEKLKSYDEVNASTQVKKEMTRPVEAVFSPLSIITTDIVDENPSELTNHEANSIDTPTVDYIRPARRFHQQSTSMVFQNNKPSTASTKLSQQQLTVLEEEVFWEFRLPAFVELNNGTFARPPINNLFFFGKRLWQLTFGQQPTDSEVFFVNLSLVERSEQDCFVWVEFILHGNQERRRGVQDRRQPIDEDTAGEPLTYCRSSSKSYCFPQSNEGNCCPQGFDNFIVASELAKFLSIHETQPHLRMSVWMRALTDQQHRLLAIEK